MRLTLLTPLLPTAVGVPAVVYEFLPAWFLPILAGLSAVLTTAKVIVTQIIRLRASAQIRSSDHALRVLEIEDLPRPRGKPK